MHRAALAIILIGCARTPVPKEPSERALYSDLERQVTVAAATGWGVDRIEVDELLESALDSVCRVDALGRRGLRAWLDEQIALRGGDVVAVWRAHGKDLGAVKDMLVMHLPFPGRPFGHPTQLGGSPDDIARDCQRAHELGAAGVDLLAYRAIEADPLELVRAARRATPGVLLVAGGVGSAAQVRALAEAGADAFTVGSAAFDLSFAPGRASLSEQLQAVLDACA